MSNLILYPLLWAGCWVGFGIIAKLTWLIFMFGWGLL